MNLEGSQPVITRVSDNSPAQAAGFQVGDVLTSLNGIPYGQGNDAVLAEMNQTCWQR
jgi:S1-C subfamily serine protease